MSEIPKHIRQCANVVVAEMDFKINEHQALMMLMFLRLRTSINKIEPDCIPAMIFKTSALECLDLMYGEFTDNQKITGAIKDAAIIECGKELDRLVDRISETLRTSLSAALGDGTPKPTSLKDLIAKVMSGHKPNNK